MAVQFPAGKVSEEKNTPLYPLPGELFFSFSNTLVPSTYR
jgi:hypothetical protein